MSGDRRAVLEAIAYGHDAKITPGDRVRALEQLADLDAQAARATATERLSPEEALAEVESLAKAAPGWLAVARGVEAVKPPASEVDGVLERQAQLIADQERELAALRAQLSGERKDRLLPAPGALVEPEVVDAEVVEDEPPRPPKVPVGIDPAAGWPR